MPRARGVQHPSPRDTSTRPPCFRRAGMKRHGGSCPPATPSARGTRSPVRMGSGIAARGQHHRHGVVVGPVSRGHLPQAPLGAGMDQVEGLRAQAQHQRLRLPDPRTGHCIPPAAPCHPRSSARHRARRYRACRAGPSRPCVGRMICLQRTGSASRRASGRGPANTPPSRRYSAPYRRRRCACDPVRCRWATPSRRRTSAKKDASSPGP